MRNHLAAVLVSVIAISTLSAERAHAQSAPEFRVVAGPRVVSDKRFEQPVPEGFHKEHVIDKGVLAAGLAAFAIGYGASALVAIPASNQGGNVLLVPFAGPFLMMSNVKQDSADCDSSKTMCLSSTWGFDGYLVLMGVAQIVGAGIFVTSLFARHTVIVPNQKSVALRDLHVVPIVSGRVAGIGLSGSF